MRRFGPVLSLASLVLFIFTAWPAAAQDIVVGTASAVSGTVTISRADNPAPAPLAPGVIVFLGDTVKTADARSTATISFIDETSVTLSGMDGTLHVEDYFFSRTEPENNRAHYRILKGAFEYAGGLIDKRENPGVSIDLDFGTIGIRGTRIYRAMKDMECWIYVEEGNISVSNDGGSVDLAPGQGTRMSATTVAPVGPLDWTPEQITWIKKEANPILNP